MKREDFTGRDRELMDKILADKLEVLLGDYIQRFTVTQGRKDTYYGSPEFNKMYREVRKILHGKDKTL